jgi:hypothetical protein
VIEYEFTLAANGLTSTEEAPLGAIYATCPDCLVHSSEGRVRFEFAREGRSLAEAVGGAILDLRKAGVIAWLEAVESPEEVADVA